MSGFDGQPGVGTNRVGRQWKDGPVLARIENRWKAVTGAAGQAKAGQNVGIGGLARSKRRPAAERCRSRHGSGGFWTLAGLGGRRVEASSRRRTLLWTGERDCWLAQDEVE